MSLPAPYYYNQYTAKERSYVDYMGSIAQATANEIQANADRQIAANALFTKEIQSTLVSNQLATETALYNHTQQLDRTLDAGFSAVSRELGYMGSAMSMGFAALNSAVERSSLAICKRLDHINETLKNPLYTESRELYNRAFKNYNKTLYEEALEDLEEAIKKNKTDPFSHFLMGQTYLYGISEFSNVINLEKAIEALTNAVKYITPDARSHAEIRPMAAEICYYLGLAYLAKANDDLHKGSKADYQSYIEKAKDAFGKSWNYSQNMLESLFNLARCKALSGEADAAETDLMTLMTIDPGYFIKAFTESDFDDTFRDGLKGRIKREIYPKAKALFDKLKSVRAELGDAISPELTASLPAAFADDTPPFDVIEGSAWFQAALIAIDLEQKRKHAAILQVHITASKYHTVGLKKDGTVVAVGSNLYGGCNTQNWRDIIAIAAGEDYQGGYTVGLKENGTVVAVGSNTLGQCNTQNWRDITAIVAGGSHTVGLKKDGTVVAVGNNMYGVCNTQDWRDIAAIATCYHTVGLKKDGTVVAVGDNKYGGCNTLNWCDIIAIAAGFHTVGLKKDGTVVAVGENKNGQCDTQDWRDIEAIAVGYRHTVGLKEDGTVVAVGDNDNGQCNTQDWRDIIAIAGGGNHTVGLKKDGTVVAVGHNGYDQCNTQNWRDIGWDPEFRKEKKLEELKRQQKEREQRQKEEAERLRVEQLRAEQQRLRDEQLRVEQARAEKQSKEWEARGLCRYCGGKMKGVFTRVCAVCGKPK